MSEFLSRVQELVAHEQVANGLKATAILVGGYLLWRAARRRLQISGLRAQQNMILRRVLGALILVLSVAWALSELGLDLRVVLGAAGVLTVAVGFAAKTSVSNLISGVFLMIEQPFAVGDAIEVAGISGEVLSVDSMAVRLRTFDNLLVRIPNETVLQANVTNFSHFDIRRFTMSVSVAYREDVARAREVLLDLAYRNPLCLAEPKPAVDFTAFGESAIQLQFRIWSSRVNFLTMRSSMFEDIKKAFEEHGIDIPFPQRTLRWAPESAGSGPAPLLAGPDSAESPAAAAQA